MARLGGEDFRHDGHSGFGFYGFPDRWEPPFDKVPIAERDRIIDNIKEAMKFMDILTKFE